jgi:hypothetical protein
VIECTELTAVDLFNAAARRIRLGDVEQYLARLRNHPPSASVGGVSHAVVRPDRDYLWSPPRGGVTLNQRVRVSKP